MKLHSMMQSLVSLLNYDYKRTTTKLFHWGNRTTFPLRKEGITSKYMGYDVFVSYAKYGKNEKRYRKKLFDDDIYEIIKNDEIYGVAYLKYSAHVDAKPHKDFNLRGKDFFKNTNTFEDTTG